MKKYILLSLCLMTLSSSFAQLKDFKFKFYGQIRKSQFNPRDARDKDKQRFYIGKHQRRRGHDTEKGYFSGRIAYTVAAHEAFLLSGRSRLSMPPYIPLTCLVYFVDQLSHFIPLPHPIPDLLPVPDG